MHRCVLVEYATMHSESYMILADLRHVKLEATWSQYEGGEGEMEIVKLFLVPRDVHESQVFSDGIADTSRIISGLDIS